MYISPDEAVVLFAIGMVYRDDMVPSLAELATADRLMTKELAGKNPGKLVSSTQRREGAVLVTDVKYAVDGRSEVFHSLACVDSKHALHMASAMCVGPDERLDACLSAQRSLKLVVPDAVTFLRR